MLPIHNAIVLYFLWVALPAEFAETCHKSYPVIDPSYLVLSVGVVKVSYIHLHLISFNTCSTLNRCSFSINRPVGSDSPWIPSLNQTRYVSWRATAVGGSETPFTEMMRSCSPELVWTSLCLMLEELKKETYSNIETSTNKNTHLLDSFGTKRKTHLIICFGK